MAGVHAVQGMAPDFLEAYLHSAEGQSFDQASRDFINAILRRESGAVISEEEFVNARKQYLPVAGDTAANLEQKAAARRTAIDGLWASSGPGRGPSEKSAGKKRITVDEYLRGDY